MEEKYIANRQFKIPDLAATCQVKGKQTLPIYRPKRFSKF